jgi:hypothetical protein
VRVLPTVDVPLIVGLTVAVARASALFVTVNVPTMFECTVQTNAYVPAVSAGTL